MDYQMIVTILIIIGAMVLFATEALRIDVVAVIIIVLLVITGILSAEQSFKGFSNSATLTVAAMFVLSGALIKTGVIGLIAPQITKLFEKSYSAVILGISVSIGFFSAFINNTPVVATFIPIISNAAEKVKAAPNKFLIPLSYAAIFGGACTLIGTSTNLLVAGIARDSGIESLRLFTITPIALLCATAGILYLLLLGKKLLPKEDTMKPLKDETEINAFLTEVEIKGLPNEKEDSISLKELFRKKDITVEVQQIKRGNKIIENPGMDIRLEAGDVLLIKGAIEKVKKLVADEHLEILKSIKDKYFPEEETKIVEIIVMPGAPMLEKKLKNINFLQRYQSNVLAIRHRGKRQFKNLTEQRLKVGDVLLLQTNERGYELLKESENSSYAPFMLMKESELVKSNKKDLVIVGSLLLAVIVTATFNILPIVVAAWTAVVVLTLLKKISMEEVYRFIDWQVIFLLAGSLSLGEAMTQSGVSTLIANNLFTLTEGTYGPFIIVAMVYLITSILTEVMSNNAAVALLAPIAIALSHSMNIDPTALLVAVMMAGSASFMTPIGYQTNTMVYSAGNYEFKDFLKVGAPLNLIFWIIASIFIPILYPL
ncbi:anion permease [Marivirga sp. S37H4]|uniref:Anion permease n=1 Tax=Marivirga aurantiaca TaxID=2802615 RepID=A0A935C739_9BACT|nr:sodium:proton antiporter [Marivirga aurantiaca]MBK6264132.1 anion permease [Marivirga aurantiaca]